MRGLKHEANSSRPIKDDLAMFSLIGVQSNTSHYLPGL